MKALIIGCNGYLGSKVTRQLLLTKNEVTCTCRAASDLSRIDDLKTDISWIDASVDAISVAMQSKDFDYIINLACDYGRDSPLSQKALTANFEFPYSVLKLAIEYGVHHFLTIGTSLPDDFNMYSFTKSKFRDFGRFYSQHGALNFYNIRLEMFYGADEPKTRFLPSVITKMICGDSVDTTIGTQRRDIVGIEDVVRAIMMIIKSSPQGFYDIPIGTGVAPHISEVIDYIWLQTGMRSHVNKGAVPMRKDEPDCIADVSFLRGLGEWNPIDWKTGISKMISDISKQIEEVKQ